MRTQNSLRNAFSALIQILVTVVLRFIAQTYFIRVLGVDYQGLNGLFTSIISMLSLSEMGLGVAIIYNMYQYIAADDTETIKSLLKFYQFLYRLVAAVITILGLAMIPLLQFFIHQGNIHENVYLIYLLFLLDAVVSYLFTYKRSILYAYQKSYVINWADLVYNIVYNLLQILFLILFKSFMAILVLVAVLRLVENFLLNLIANHRYPYIKEKNVHKLKLSIAQKFMKQMRGQFVHSFAGFVVFGTDSMIISSFLGLTVMGLYSNYIFITTTLSNLFSQIVGGVTASVGNLLTEDNLVERFDIYKKLTFFCFWLFTFSSISIYVMMTPFIVLWLGKSFLLSSTVLFVIALNFYVQGMRRPISVFQVAGGIFYENRRVALVEAVLNLILSIVFVKFFGLAGVLWATVMSTLLDFGYSYVKYTYVPLFKKKGSSYLIEQLTYLLIFLILFFTTVEIGTFVSTSNIWLNFLNHGLISLIIPNVMLYLLFARTTNFKYFKELMLKKIMK